MNASLRALLSGVVDYAGLFPPAQLPLDQAIRNYARYRQEADAWMLGRFVIPVSRLLEWDAFADLFQAHSPCAFSALGQDGDLEKDRESIQTFTEAHRGRVRVEALEVRLPQGGIPPLPGLSTRTSSPSDWKVFYEGAVNDNVLQFLSERRSGFKLRCGGLDASAFPTVDHAAFVLRACRDAGVPLKFTAGLHHPIRRFDAGLQTHVHGFVNVFTAGVLAHARWLDEEVLRAVIADEDPAAFRLRRRRPVVEGSRTPLRRRSPPPAAIS